MPDLDDAPGLIREVSGPSSAHRSRQEGLPAARAPNPTTGNEATRLVTNPDV